MNPRAWSCLTRNIPGIQLGRSSRSVLLFCEIRKALIDLGQGFLEDPTNKRLRELLTSEKLSTVEYYKQVIRVIYRLMFLFAGEDHDSLFPIDCDPAAKENYLKFYSVSRLRDIAAKMLGTRHGDLWSGLKRCTGSPLLIAPFLS
jgi:hypothetical protein